MSDPTGDTGSRPLAGLRVIDLATVVMGPYAAGILGDLGADVIKLETPSGDPIRHAQPQRTAAMSAPAMALNRNKRSIALDLKTERSKQAMLDLTDTADVLITNMRPGALNRLGLDHEQLRDRNPKLVYCQAQGFRSDSEFADNAAYDEIVQASSGLVDIMHRGTGKPAYVPTVLGDKVCAQTIVYSVLAALRQRDATGTGQRVEVPMVDTMLAFNLVEHLDGRTFEPAVGGAGADRFLVQGHEAVATEDGWAAILPYSGTQIREFFLGAERPDLADDPRFATAEAREENRAELYRLIEELAATRTTQDWAEICARRSVPMAPVMNIDSAPEDPYVAAGGLIEKDEHPTVGTYRRTAFPVRFSHGETGFRQHCPEVGQHNAEVLGELGYAADEIDEITGAR